jgi:hypothetical protein
MATLLGMLDHNIKCIFYIRRTNENFPIFLEKRRRVPLGSNLQIENLFFKNKKGTLKV